MWSIVQNTKAAGKFLSDMLRIALPDDAEKYGKFQLCGLTVLIVKGDDVEVGRSSNVTKYPRPDEIHPFPEFFYEQD